MERTKRTIASVEQPLRIRRNDPEIRSRTRNRRRGRYEFCAGRIDRYGAGANDKRATHVMQSQRPVGGALANTGQYGGLSSLQGKRILLVEDEPALAIDVAMMLEEFGMNVIGPYANLKQGLASAEVEMLDLAMLDVNLRGEMSYPIADILSRRGVPLIFATGYDSVSWSGFAPRISKPYSQRDIATALLSVVS